MRPSPPNLRYERKFMARGLPAADVLAFVRRHPALFRECYPPRFVNNIYLDTDSLRDYFDHVHGIANRTKTRIRWYGPFRGPVAKPVLERKIKRGVVSGKESYPLPPLVINGGIDRRHLAESLPRESVPSPLRPFLEELHPASANRYYRHYYATPDGQLRLTVDLNLAFLAPNGQGHWISLNQFPQAGPILELKYRPEDSERAAAVANAFPIRLGRCSKYVLGMEAIRGH